MSGYLQIRSVLRSWRLVFSRWQYLLLAILIALVFYEFNVLVSNIGNVTTFFSLLGILGGLKFLLFLSLGFYATVQLHSFIILLIVSVLFGMMFSLVAYKAKVLGQGQRLTGSKKGGFFGSVGVFLGVLVPGCAACGLGILPALGVSSAFLFFLPYDGLELSILAVGLLTFGLWKISKDLLTCDNVSKNIVSKKSNDTFKK